MRCESPIIIFIHVVRSWLGSGICLLGICHRQRAELESGQAVQVQLESTSVTLVPYGRVRASYNHMWNFRDYVVLQPRTCFHLSLNSQHVNLEHVGETEGGSQGKHEQDLALRRGLIRWTDYITTHPFAALYCFLICLPQAKH